MHLETQRFGNIEVANEQLLLFPGGLIGMERLRQWAMIPDAQNDSLAWLQSTSNGRIALPVISPRLYFPDYRVRISPRGLESLRIRPGQATYILTTVSEHGDQITTNLHAPLVINVHERLGAQIVTTDTQPLRQRISLSLQRAAA
ncbi:MAG: flagellar assembly protein FliW [Planctomycetota bacterium]